MPLAGTHGFFKTLVEVVSDRAAEDSPDSESELLSKANLEKMEFSSGVAFCDVWMARSRACLISVDVQKRSYLDNKI